MYKKNAFGIATILCLSLTTHAQEKNDSIAVASPPVSPITIQTDIDSAVVFIDGDSVGITPLTIPSLGPGMYRIRIVPRDAANWLSEPLIDSISVSPATAQTFRFTLKQKILILSSPSGAEVFSKDSSLGTTPLVIAAELPSLRLKKDRYEEINIDAANAHRGIVSTQLKKIWQGEAEEAIFEDSGEKGSSLRLYITGATTILAGAASAYFKVKADNTYSQYVRTGEPSALSEVNRLDTAAGIALAATQISLGLFTYFILSE